MLEERHRPIGFLRDFNLIDTPGTNSIVQGHQEITARFLPSADLILFVFPVTNPWGAATWNFISELTPECLQRVVFIIQQADQREAIDLSVIQGHMKDLSNKRIGILASGLRGIRQAGLSGEARDPLRAEGSRSQRISRAGAFHFEKSL